MLIPLELDKSPKKQVTQETEAVRRLDIPSRGPQDTLARPFSYHSVMASTSPPTPAKVPASAASYTPATLDPDLRSQINSLLIRDGHVTK